MSDTSSTASDNLRGIIQTAPLAIVILDTNDRVTAWNPAAERIFGWNASEVLGQPPPFVPEDEQAEFAAVRARERAGEFFNAVELRLQRKDGTPTDVRLWTAPLREAAGRITDVVGILEDVTDRRRTEAVLREHGAQRDLVLRNIPVVLYRAQASGVFAGMWVTENVERVTGFPAARFAAEPAFWAARLHPADRDEVFRAFGGLQGGATAKCQYRWQCADGTYRWFLDEAYLRPGDGERPPEYLGTWLDITAQKQLEAEAHARELRLRMALEAAGMVAWEWDIPAGIIRYSENVSDVARGTAVAPYCALDTLLAEIHPDDRAGLVAALDRTRHEGQPFACEYRVRMLDSTYRWILGQSGRVLMENGTPVRALGISTDITERKQIEIAVRDQRDLALFLATTDRLAEGLQRCLETACRVAGLDAGGFYLVDETTGTLDLHVHRGLSSPFVRSVSSYGPESKNARLVMAGTPVYGPYRQAGLPVTAFEQQEGLRFLAIVPVEHNGRVIGCLNVASHVIDDISELARHTLETIGAQIGRVIAQLKMEEALRASDERFRRLAADTDTGLVVVDGAGIVLEANEPFLRLTGHKKMEQIIGRSVLEWTAADAKEANAAAVARCVRQGRIQDFETIYQHQDGKRAHVLINAVAQRNGGSTRLVSYCKDITERKEAEAKLALRTNQLEAVRSVSMELTQTLEVAPLLNLILQRATELVGVPSGALYRWEETTQELVAAVRVGPSDPTPPTRFRLGEAVAGTVALRREGLLVNDFRTSPYVTPWFLEHTTHTAVLAEPLLNRGQLLGVVVLSNFQMPGRVFGDENQNLLRLFAAQAAIAIQNAELLEAAERDRRATEIVASLSRDINSSLDLAVILQKVTDGARELTRADLAYIALRDAATESVVFRHGAGSRYEAFKNLRIEPGKGVGGQVLATGAPFRTAHYAEEPRITKDYLAVTLSEGVVAELAVAIRTETGVEGVLFASNRSARPFTERDERTLQQLADHIAVAIRNARLHEAALRRARHLAALNTVTQAVMTELTPHSATQRPKRVLEGVQVLFPGAASMILERSGDAAAFRVAASLGFRHRQSEEPFRLPPGEGLAGIAMATRRPVVSYDLATDPRFVNQAWALSEGLVAAIVLPLVIGDRVTGVLGVFLRRSWEVDADEVDLVHAFAAQCAIGLENARLFQEVSVGREQLANLTQRVVTAQEEERQHLARDLHDDVGQVLTALRMNLDLIAAELPAGAGTLHRKVADAAELSASITNQIRGLAQALRPPALEAFGVHVALDGLCREWSRRTGVHVAYAGRDLPGLPYDVGIHLYRVVQEALTNIGKHANVARARVALEYTDGVVGLAVEDDGAGFDTTAVQTAAGPRGLGLISIRERVERLGGQLVVASQVGQGTRLQVRVPWRGGA